MAVLRCWVGPTQWVESTLYMALIERLRTAGTSQGDRRPFRRALDRPEGVGILAIEVYFPHTKACSWFLSKFQLNWHYWVHPCPFLSDNASTQIMHRESNQSGLSPWGTILAEASISPNGINTGKTVSTTPGVCLEGLIYQVHKVGHSSCVWLSVVYAEWWLTFFTVYICLPCQ